MLLTALNAISPIDGRYRSKTKSLSAYFSEEALIKYRVQIEIEYFIGLCELPLPQLADFNPSLFEELRSIYLHFTSDDALQIKEIESTTNHDVKAVEYFIKKEFDKLQLQEYKEFIHFGLTSQDINNTAIPLSVKNAVHEVYHPELENVIQLIEGMVIEYKDIPLLARTHGQPASPTRLGKEFDVFVQRLNIQKAMLLQIPNGAKFSGATGNFNAHKVAYPDIDVRIKAVDFDEGFLDESIDIAIYYGRGRWSGLHSEQLHKEYLTPVCSPMLFTSNKPLNSLADLSEHILLHDSSRENWKQWLKQFNMTNVNVNQGPMFSHSMLVLQAAALGQGVALANTMLAKPDIDSGRLICPFSERVESKDGFYIVSEMAHHEQEKITLFREWLLSQVENEDYV